MSPDDYSVSSTTASDSTIFGDLSRTNKLIEKLLERLHPVLVFREDASRLTQVDPGQRSNLRAEVVGINGRLENILQAIDL